MKKFAALLLLVTIAVAATVSPGQAGWKKRGWYMKKPGTECTMRLVSVTTASGKVITKAIRVCG